VEVDVERHARGDRRPGHAGEHGRALAQRGEEALRLGGVV
jgi:hypothetical protein